ncbi:MAG TPA: 6-phosphofructokinase, partial [Pirellulales bacterium]
ANKFERYQDHLPAGSKRIRVVHLPKTIDNDYLGIDFTFGYFTAVETLASEMRNLLYDAEASRAYFMCETMGRSAGWLAYGAAIAGDASLVLSVEDITGKYLTEEEVVDADGKKTKRKVMNVEEVGKRIVRTMRFREEHEKKNYGVIVVAEGIGELLPHAYVKDVERDDFGHIAISKLHLGRILAKVCADEYTKQTGKTRKITGLQLGYEARCAPPHAFDVMLGSQLGVGAYRALVEKNLDGVMVSITGQLELRYVPFTELVDPETLVTVVRFIQTGSDFHQLARFLEAGAQES